ncbi:MAG: sulfotransferase [Gammaproteobacteria bacterium]
MNNYPDFIIAGAAKSGTTALHYMLDQHPNIFMSGIKETNYFVYGYEHSRHWRDHSGLRPLENQPEDDITDSPEKYRKLFSAATKGQLLGESSPLYLLNNTVPQRILEHNPETKIILILRNPVEVAFANFVHQVRDSTESIGLADVNRILESEHYQKKDLHPFANHLQLPEYSRQLPFYLEAFNQDSITVIIYEEFIKDKRNMLKSLFSFLGVSDHPEINVDKRVNISGMPKNKKLQEAIQGNPWWKSIAKYAVPKKPRRKVRAMLEAMNTGKKPVITQSLRDELNNRFAKDVTYLESYLGREISVWKK